MFANKGYKSALNGFPNVNYIQVSPAICVAVFQLILNVKRRQWIIFFNDLKPFTNLKGSRHCLEIFLFPNCKKFEKSVEINYLVKNAALGSSLKPDWSTSDGKYVRTPSNAKGWRYLGGKLYCFIITSDFYLRMGRCILVLLA